MLTIKKEGTDVENRGLFEREGICQVWAVRHVPSPKEPGQTGPVYSDPVCFRLCLLRVAGAADYKR